MLQARTASSCMQHAALLHHTKIFGFPLLSLWRHFLAGHLHQYKKLQNEMETSCDFGNRRKPHTGYPIPGYMVRYIKLQQEATVPDITNDTHRGTPKMRES